MKKRNSGVVIAIGLTLILAGNYLHSQTGTFTEVHDMPCGDTTTIGSLGYPTWNPPHIVERPGFGHAVLLGDFVEPNLLQYIAPICFTGRDTVVIECAHATQISCDTGIYIFDITCPESLSTVYPSEVMCNDSIYIGNLSGFGGPYIIQGPAHGSATIILEPTDGAGVFYRPDTGFEGVDAVKVGLVTTMDTLLYLFQVYCDQIVSRVISPEIASITTFPNPGGDDLFFQLEEPVQEAEIFELTGKRLISGFSETGSGYRIQTGGLAPGAYILRVQTPKGIRIGKFIKH